MAGDTPLQDSAAIITGASAGIGRESARALAADGANVVLAARREERLREIADDIEDEYGVAAEAVPTDVTERSSVQALVDETVDTFGGLDVVVANAGTGTEGGLDIEDVPIEQYRTVMDVNVDGMFHTTQAAMPHLRESNGNLVFVASFAGQYPRPNAVVYAATKWWTRGFALSLAGQVGEDDVAVSVINPTEVRTEFAKEYRDTVSKEKFEPGEVTEPEDIADAVAFAARQEVPNAAAEIDLYRRDKFAHF